MKTVYALWKSITTLENSAGTQNYSRQVSALLDDTVESPGFDLKLPPLDNCAPNSNESENCYPLWYKDPNKIPQISRKQFQELKNNYQSDKPVIQQIGKGFKEMEKSNGDSSDFEVDLDTRSESDEDDSSRKKYNYEHSRTLSETETEDEEEEEDEEDLSDWGTDAEDQDSELEFEVADNFCRKISTNSVTR